MKLVLDGIKPEDKNLAINVMNYLKSGNRVIGDPGEGLRQTLAKLEEISISTAYSWLNRWNENGIESLRTKPRSERPGRPAGPAA